MSDILLLTLEEMAAFLAFFAIGALLSRRHVLPADAGTTLAKLVTFVFLPAMTFNGFAQQFTLAKIGGYAALLAAGVVVALLSVLISIVMRRALPGDRFEKLAAAYSMVVPNFGYLGYPLVLALFGQEMLTKFMMFALPFNLYIYGYAMPQWMPENGEKGGFFRRVMSAPMIAMLAGIAFGLSGLPYPALVQKICSSASGCMGPCAMIIAGLAIGRLSMKTTFSEKRAYAVSAVRLLLLPALFIAAVFGLSRLLHWNSDLLLVIGTYVSLPLGMNPVVFSETYGEDGSFGAECALISMLLSVATLPLTLRLLERLAALI